MNKTRKGGLSFYHKEKKITNEKIAHAFGYLFWAVLAVILSYVLVWAVGIKTSMIGSSMEPELYNGQEVLIDRFLYNFIRPGRGDVIVFRPNGNENAHLYIKRVVGIPGDTIQIKNGVLILNGVEQPLLFADRIEEAGTASEVITIPEDEYFVMGDNCNNSEDSRSVNLGNVRIDTIYGKAWFHMAAENSGLGTIGKVYFNE
ncbi:MAG: signal peptidase I [Lachnospiraceae bacterium]|nr:signal peptidase I [Lachnospiraceae bacterium]